MLALAVRNTKKLVRRRVKEANERIGNRFTKENNAALMASLVKVPSRETVSVLDCGAGTGILSAAIAEHICKSEPAVRFIELVAYENDTSLLPMLEDNLERIRKRCKHDYDVRLRIKLVSEDFIKESACAAPDRKRKSDIFEGFDIAILNPPTELAENGSEYARRLPDIVSSTVSEAYIFTALALDALREDGQLVAYLPQAFAHGDGLAKFRKYIFEKSRCERLHLFLDELKREGAEPKIRKNLIIKLCKTQKKRTDTAISTSIGDEISGKPRLLPPLPYEFVVSGKNHSLTLVKSILELKLYVFMASMPNTLSSLGLRMRTGLTLESRYPEFIHGKPTEGAVPLITPKNIVAGHIDLSVCEKYITPVIKSLAQPNKNMLLIKRVPSKADARHLVCAVYLASQAYGSEQISTHNKLHYIDYPDERELGATTLLGLYALFSSSVYERYCTIVSGDSVSNISAYENLPLPELDVIKKIGAGLSSARTFSSLACDNLVNSALGTDKLLGK